MSFFPAKDPTAGDAPSCDAVELVIVPRTADLGAFSVRRVLPNAQRRMVGPFIFLDHFGPVEFHAGQGMDVRPHPHIGLATVTYLHAGEIVHRDSLGTEIAIRPGEINWMNAGRGITHSERSRADRTGPDRPLHGFQLWVALPSAAEQGPPGFWHHSAAAFPVVEGEGKTVRLLAGSLFGERSPVETASDTIFADVRLAAGASLPFDAAHEERAIYPVSGEIEIGGDRFQPGRLLVLKGGENITVKAVSDAHMIIVGGATLDGPRYIWWNFVSSRKERIEQAKADWKAARFDMVPGESEFIPLPAS